MKNRSLFWLVVAIVALVVFLCQCENPRHRKQIPEKDTIVQIQPTVQEVLQWRENMRLQKYEDSVFLVMPEQILTHILVTKGTDLSNHEIVALYISNKDFYDNLIKKSMDIQKQYIPDSMPKPSLPQKNSDTIHASVYTNESLKQ